MPKSVQMLTSTAKLAVAQKTSTPQYSEVKMNNRMAFFTSAWNTATVMPCPLSLDSAKIPHLFIDYSLFAEPSLIRRGSHTTSMSARKRN